MSNDEHVEPGSNIERDIERILVEQLRAGDTPTTFSAVVGVPEVSAAEAGDTGGDGD